MTLLSLAISTALVCAAVFLFGHIPHPQLRIAFRIAAAVLFLVWVLLHAGLFAAVR